MPSRASHFRGSDCTRDGEINEGEQNTREHSGGEVRGGDCTDQREVVLVQCEKAEVLAPVLIPRGVDGHACLAQAKTQLQVVHVRLDVSAGQCTWESGWQRASAEVLAEEETGSL